jgi:CYTH domain-containing protein
VIRRLDEELRALKYSHVERERRFLVDPALRPDLHGRPYILIEDLYIDGTRMRLRRMTASDTGRVVFKLSKKYETGDPQARPMVTTYLSDAEYALLASLPARGLVKRRYPLGEFSIDLFEGALAGLETAESEQPDEVALMAFVPPEWAIKEVSDDPHYDGGTLALLDKLPLS